MKLPVDCVREGETEKERKKRVREKAIYRLEVVVVEVLVVNLYLFGSSPGKPIA